MNAQKAAPSRSTWEEIRRLLHPWRGQIVMIALGVLIFEGLSVIPPLLLQRIIDEHLVPGITTGLLFLALLYLAATMLAVIFNSGVSYLTAWVAQHALRDMRVDLFDHLLHLPLGYHDRTPLGDVISRCTADVDTVDTLFTTGVSNLLLRLVQLVTTFAAMVLLSPPLAMLAILLLPPLALATRFFQVHIRDAERQRRITISMLNVYLQETLSGIEVVRAYYREGTMLTRFRRALQENLAAFWYSESYNMFYTPSLMVLVALCVSLLLWSGTGGIGQNWDLSIGTIIAFIILFQRFFEPVRNLGEDWQTVQSALSGVERIVQVLQTPIDVPVSTSNSLQPGDGALVALRDVTFGYLADHPVLHDITLSVHPGEHVAVVGRTGAGKSSLVNLVAGLYAPWSGEVFLAGLDPYGLSDTQRRRVVGMVPQVVQLFSGTVWENLTIGDLSVSRQAVERAAKMAGVDRFVPALPEAYDTLLSGVGGGMGVRLSEGQQQLLSLARALVWDPAVFLLDEATSAVDNASESEIRTTLRAVFRGDDGGQRAAVTVAHRLSTAREADRVIVLDNGRIVEQGDPDYLIQRGGWFAALVELEEAGWDWRDPTYYH
jgi:ATP-binding cassette subfamily B multidrug efflux pump